MTTFINNKFGRKHQWVTVINPINHQSLLQACDCCGVVKSENSIIRNCKAANNGGLITGAMGGGAKAG